MQKERFHAFQVNDLLSMLQTRIGKEKLLNLFVERIMIPHYNTENYTHSNSRENQSMLLEAIYEGLKMLPSDEKLKRS